jgi:hypothetical protein
VSHAARVRLVEFGPNVNGVTQRIFGRQRASGESLGQELADHGLATVKTHFALARFDHDLSTRRHFPRTAHIAALNQILLSAVPNHNEPAPNQVPSVLPDDGAAGTLASARRCV